MRCNRPFGSRDFSAGYFGIPYATESKYRWLARQFRSRPQDFITSKYGILNRPRNTAVVFIEKHEHYDHPLFLSPFHLRCTLDIRTRIMRGCSYANGMCVLLMLLVLGMCDSGRSWADAVLLKRKQHDKNLQTAATRARLRLPSTSRKTEAHACVRSLPVLRMLLAHTHR